MLEFASQKGYSDLILRSVVDYAIYLVDGNGYVTSWNVGAERIKRYAGDEIIGKHFSIFYTEEDRKAGVPERALETARAQGRFEAEGWRVRQDQSRFWASAVMDAVHNDEGEVIGFVKVTRDLTERRETEGKLAVARDQLYQSQKMEALGQLTGGMAHDFNNILTAVIGGADLASKIVSENAKVVRILGKMKESAQKGAAITGQLLAFSNKQTLKTQTVDLSENFTNMTALLRHSMRKDINIITEIMDDLWKVDTELAQLELALLQLCFNARDAMPDGGTMRISALNTVLDGSLDGLRGEHVAISVSDGGVGIPEDIQHRIFEPFFTTKALGQGLGLSTVYGFAKKSEGAVRVVSSPGQGTTVTIYLPVTTTMVVQQTTPVPGRRRILIVEDEIIVAEVAAMAMEEWGFDCDVAHSAVEALSLISQGLPYDLVFSDIVMPGKSGVELGLQIRSEHPEIPVLLTTGYTSETREKLSNFPLIPKPYDLDHLQTSISDLLRNVDSAV